ncbi:hypothetical protein [Klebsiella pneumoniae]
MKTQPATGETYPKSDLFNKAEDIYSQPVEKHMIYFVSSYAVVTIIRILSQSQDTSRHEPWR